MGFDRYILVCGDDSCKKHNSAELYNNLIHECEVQGVKESVQILKTGSFGLCSKGNIVKVLPDDTLYMHMAPEDAAGLISEHVVKGNKYTKKLYKDISPASVKAGGVTGYHKQLRIVLRNCGVIDPENINEYIAREGYLALEKAVFEMSPDDIIQELKSAGLRGRGGAGFPTWMKWNKTQTCEGEQKYVVCNADEGDPGAYMDRSNLEGDPHSLLEAMAIAGYTVGASKGYIYIRAEYPLAISRLEKAMTQAREFGVLGDNILGSDFSFDIEIRLGAGAFVCGEETALLASIEGKRGMPVPRPPFPSTKGLWGMPTVINNVETWANIPVIILKGGSWYSAIGTENSKGTKVFALTGNIRNSGLVEVPMGTTLREIVYDIGGGIPGGKAFKAIQTGGPSGGVITAKYLDTPIDYDQLSKLGSIMGSGGMIVMDEDDCMVDIAKFYLGFSVEESCGKCAPCRIGSRTLYNTLDRITKGAGEPVDIDNMKRIGHAMQKASLCGLGQTASNPVLSTIQSFKSEYMSHIDKKLCSTGTCKDLVSYAIIQDNCIGCGLCARKCPVNAITGEKRHPHEIDQNICIKCGECFKVCKFDAVRVQ